MQRFMDIDTAWTIANDGAVTVSMKVKRDMNYPELPRFGIRLFLPKEMDQITYCGIGPMESYCDKRIAGSYGLLVTPFLVKKLHGMYKLNLVGYILGTMFSCSSFGTKLGGGIGTALSGWLLAASGFINDAVVQSAGCVQMISIMYLVIPTVINLVIALVLSRLKVEQVNAKLVSEKE